MFRCSRPFSLANPKSAITGCPTRTSMSAPSAHSQIVVVPGAAAPRFAASAWYSCFGTSFNPP
jgi:hypothetical protein